MKASSAKLDFQLASALTIQEKGNTGGTAGKVSVKSTDSEGRDWILQPDLHSPSLRFSLLFQDVNKIYWMSPVCCWSVVESHEFCDSNFECWSTPDGRRRTAAPLLPLLDSSWELALQATKESYSPRSASLKPLWSFTESDLAPEHYRGGCVYVANPRGDHERLRCTTSGITSWPESKFPIFWKVFPKIGKYSPNSSRKSRSECGQYVDCIGGNSTWYKRPWWTCKWSYYRLIKYKSGEIGNAHRI